MPVSALPIETSVAEGLTRLGLHKITNLADVPRARRLDQAIRTQAEPVAAATDAPHFGVRTTLPEPIGLTVDVTLLQRLVIGPPVTGLLAGFG